MDGSQPTMNTTAEVNERVPLQQQRWFKIVLWISYCIIFLLGVTGNTIVCYILYRRKSLRTVTNLFILNLAISDLIFSGSIPLEFPIIMNNYKWPYASFFCKIYVPVQTIALSVSICTLTSVSLIRYRAIMHPLKLQVTLLHGNYILTGIWIFSSLLLVPYVLTLKMQGNVCGEEWPDLVYRKMYTVFLFTVLYVIPLSIIVFTYTTIVRELMKKGKGPNSALNEAWNKETAGVIRMFFKVTLVFAVCNLPSQLMWLWLDFGSADQTFDYFWDLLSALNILIFANSAANPFIYYICHDRFRTEAVIFFSSVQWLTRLRHFCRRNKEGQERRELMNIAVKEDKITRRRPLSDSSQNDPLAIKVIDKTEESFV